MNNENSKFKASMNNSLEKRKLSNSAILKKWSEYEDSIDKSLSPLFKEKGEGKSEEELEEKCNFLADWELQTNEKLNSITDEKKKLTEIH